MFVCSSGTIGSGLAEIEIATLGYASLAMTVDQPHIVIASSPPQADDEAISLLNYKEKSRT
jgi:hypothetical protein